MAKLNIRKLAREVAHDLFTDGEGITASRLVLERKDDRIGNTGWAEPFMAKRIEVILRKALSPTYK